MCQHMQLPFVTAEFQFLLWWRHFWAPGDPSQGHLQVSVPTGASPPAVSAPAHGAQHVHAGPSLPALQPLVLVWCWDRQAPLHSLITRAATIVLQDFHNFASYFCHSPTATWFYTPSQFDGIAPCTDHICVHIHPRAPSVAMGCGVSFGPHGSHPLLFALPHGPQTQTPKALFSQQLGCPRWHIKYLPCRTRRQVAANKGTHWEHRLLSSGQGWRLAVIVNICLFYSMQAA